LEWSDEEKAYHVGDWWYDPEKNIKRVFSKEYKWETLTSLPKEVEANIKTIEFLKKEAKILNDKYTLAKSQLD
jgi:hypothetical protein